MKKIININFHSRVIPIEETAYEILQQYIDSLRRYFANEEGRDEIISDIENRFSELFAETLKKGAPCITDEDVNVIIVSMGRPEEFEGEGAEAEAQPRPGTTSGTGSSYGAGSGAGGGNPTGSTQSSQGYSQSAPEEGRRLFRAGNDKILGGVCAGLANYLRLDPAIVRILFVLISFTWGFGFLLYIVLWIVLPTRSLQTNARKRLYRNSDDRVIAGVASGLAAYFHIDVWIPRLIFALPLILGIISSIFQNIWWHWHFEGPVFFTGGFGGSLFIAYIVLWIVLPQAVTASEKLEMRGEKIDLESIKNTVKSDLETFKGRAKEMGAEMQERFQKVGKEMGPQIRENVQNFSAEAGSFARKSGTGIGHAIGVLFKAFFLLIAGCVAFALIVALTSVAFGGDGVLHLKNYILAGFWQNLLVWSSLTLFLLLPVVALLTWLIRRITGMRSRRHYLGYMFATLWIIGLISFIVLAGMIMNNFRSRQHTEEEFALTQPAHGLLIVRASQPPSRFYNDDDWWFGDDWNWKHHGLFYSINEDSLLLNTVQINLLKSEDSSYHVRVFRISRGNNTHMAIDLARQISFPVTQADSVLTLPGGFAITRDEKFRNQQVVVAIAIPLGKKILVDKSVNSYDWFNISANHSHLRWSRNWHDDEYSDEDLNLENTFYWNSSVQYIMTPDGLSKIDREERQERTQRPEKAERPERKEKPDQGDSPEYQEKKKNKSQHGSDNDGYRYNGPEKPARKNNADSPALKSTTMLNVPGSGQFILLSSLVNPF
jgi:phage shock protein PspC (stress-responsive transcriptional regulator)